MKYPTVSVIMAVKDRQGALENCLYSWSNLIYPSNYEFIVIDDGSEIDLQETVMSFSKDIKSLSYHKIPNKKDRTPNIAWNFGYKMSKYDFVVFTCGDLIISSKDILQRMVEAYQGERVSVLTYLLSQRMSFDLVTRIDWKSDPKLIETATHFWEDESVDNFPNRNRLAAGLTSYCTGQYREDWKWIGGFRNEDTHLVSDQDMHLREKAVGRGVSTAQGVVAYHQWHQRPMVTPGLSYVYENEQQARLLEPARKEK